MNRKEQKRVLKAIGRIEAETERLRLLVGIVKTDKNDGIYLRGEKPTQAELCLAMKDYPRWPFEF